MRIDKKKLQADIAEAFDFARFLVRHPGALRTIENDSEIEFLPVASSRLIHGSGHRKRVQAFSAETVFRPL